LNAERDRKLQLLKSTTFPWQATTRIGDCTKHGSREIEVDVKRSQRRSVVEVRVHDVATSAAGNSDWALAKRVLECLPRNPSS
jgi:hypothetical protein